ncbi:MAG: TIR domain-containing protein, partial [Gammaproteobacteria bacterium]
MKKHDIFISFSHIDNRAPFADVDGWVTTFHQCLESRVATLLGRAPRIWRDPKLGGNDYLSDELSERLANSAVLISIVSPSYLRSKWCEKERDIFIEHAQRNG